MSVSNEICPVFPRTLPQMAPTFIIGPESEVEVQQNDVLRRFFSRELDNDEAFPLKALVKSALPPFGSTVTFLPGPFEVKRAWMQSERTSPHFEGRLAQKIDQYAAPFPNEDQPSATLTPDEIARITTCFENTRGGKSDLWGLTRERADWALVQHEAWPLDWVQKNVRVLYPKEEDFDIDRICPAVAWKNAEVEPYQLTEGNHRVSTWLRREYATLPMAMFIGRVPIHSAFPVVEIDGPPA